MFIDTNREQSEYEQDDHYISTDDGYCPYLQQIKDLWYARQAERAAQTWTWPKEHEYKKELYHLRNEIRAVKNIW